MGGGEFVSRSKVVNDMIYDARQREREAETIRTRLIASERSVAEHGWIIDTPEEILKGFKDRARRNGKLSVVAQRTGKARANADFQQAK